LLCGSGVIPECCIGSRLLPFGNLTLFIRQSKLILNTKYSGKQVFQSSF
jgi:hypothetical protein